MLSNSGRDVVLQVDAVSKSFGGVQVVDGVSFAASRGEVLGLVGPNGAGKTTLLRMIVNILRPNEGSVLVFGEEANPKTQNLVGYLPEERGLYQRERVGKTLVYLARLKGLSTLQLKGRIRTQLREIGLADEWDQRVQKLSKGQQQKLQFAATITTDPDLVLLDEPFSGLDPLNRWMVAQVVRDLADAGKTVVLSTHEMGRVESMCDRLLMLHHGRIVLSGTLDEVREACADEAVLVETTADLSAIPGVVSVESKNGCSRVILEPTTTRKQFLTDILATGADIRSFEPDLPSVEEIFVKTVQEVE